VVCVYKNRKITEAKQVRIIHLFFRVLLVLYSTMFMGESSHSRPFYIIEKRRIAYASLGCLGVFIVVVFSLCLCVCESV